MFFCIQIAQTLIGVRVQYLSNSQIQQACQGTNKNKIRRASIQLKTIEICRVHKINSLNSEIQKNINCYRRLYSIQKHKSYTLCIFMRYFSTTLVKLSSFPCLTRTNELMLGQHFFPSYFVWNYISVFSFLTQVQSFPKFNNIKFQLPDIIIWS